MYSAHLTLLALTAGDGFENERTELLAAGVPLHRINALYPLTFDAMAETLRVYLDRLGRVHTFYEEDRDKFSAGDEALWDSLADAEKQQAMASIRTVLNDDELKYDITVAPKARFRRYGETAASQASTDLQLLCYAMAYLLYGSAKREAAAEHLREVASALLPDLIVARVTAIEGVGAA